MTGDWDPPQGGEALPQTNTPDFVVRPGSRVYDARGEPLGSVSRVFGERTSGTAWWVTVPMGHDEKYVPLDAAQIHGDVVHLVIGREHVETSPTVTGDFGRSAEERLTAYYGIAPPDRDSEHTEQITGGGPPAGPPAGGGKRRPPKGAKLVRDEFTKPE